MRVSTQQLHQRAIAVILDQQAGLSKTQQQVATGERILNPADDPAGAARILQLEREIAVTRQHQANAEAAYHRQAVEEQVLASVGDLLQRVGELAVQGNNDSYSPEDRRAIAQELGQRLDELLGLANTRDANGEYLFSGFQGNTRPFGHDGNGQYRYSGDQGQRFLRVGPNTQVAVGDSGAEIFQFIRAGNGVFTTQALPTNSGTGVISTGTEVGAFIADSYALVFFQAQPQDPLTYEVRDSANDLVASGDYVEGGTIAFNGAEISVSGSPAQGDGFTIDPSAHQDMFTTLHQLMRAFEEGGDDPVSRAQLHNQVNRSLSELDNASQNLLEVRARVGSRLNTVESQRDANEAFLLTARTTLSQVRDLDYAEAVSRLNLQLTGLQAAQQSYAQIQGLSLFDYLR